MEENVREQSDSSIDTLAIPESAHAQEIFDDKEKSSEVTNKMIDFLK